MTSSIFAEDIFLRFYALVQNGQLSVQHQDFGPILSFHTKIEDGNQLTKNQADYIIKILEKYKNMSAMLGVDYRQDMQSVKWKLPFRVLDLTKSIYVEKNSNGRLDVCLKFPFQLKKEFDEEINVNLNGSNRVSHWDSEDKVRRLSLYDFNLVTLYEFARKHGFDIDDSFMSVLADVEEIWQNADQITPYCTIEKSLVTLHNASPEVKEWWVYNHRQKVDNDLLLAKSMGFLLKQSPKTMAEKIASSPENAFWIKTNEELFALTSSLQGRVCIVLDRSSDTLAWLKNFVATADSYSVPREEIKVCFRDHKDSKSGLNEWVKLAGVGGKVEDGKILIFESKPAKWLFKDEQDVKLLVTNNIYPPTNSMAKDWFSSHPCVVFLGETKPTEQRGQRIVEL